MKRRIVIYTAGMAVLAFGIILNTKTGLGIGTLVAAIGIGRTIAVYHKLHILELK